MSRALIADASIYLPRLESDGAPAAVIHGMSEIETNYQAKLQEIELQLNHARNEAHRYELSARLLETERLEIIENLRILSHEVI